MATIQLITYEDAINHVMMAVSDNDWSDRWLALARRAVLTAYRDLPSKHSWNYLSRKYNFATIAPYATGTIAFDFTGGASERLITLTGGTFPSDATNYEMQIAGVNYAVETRESDTTLTLTPRDNPGIDVASGTSYSLFKEAYDLPVDFRRITSLYDTDADRQIRISDIAEAHAHGIVWETPATPDTAAVMSRAEYYGSLSLVFAPPPGTARTYTVLYKAALRPLTSPVVYDTGTVSTSGTALSGLGTNFTDADIGRVVRFGGTTSLPTGEIGSTRAGVGSYLDNVYSAQRIIVAVSSTTAATLDAAVTGDVASLNLYTVSDPIDLEPGAMLTFFFRSCESEYALLARHEDRHERSAVANKYLREAMAADDRVRSTPYSIAYAPFHLRAWSTYPVGSETVN